MQRRPELKFPKGFLWGVSSSAHQIEGNTHNQWSVWELENAKSLAAQSSYQYDDLESWSRVKNAAKSAHNYVSGVGANHYELYEQDIAIAKKMHMNAWRFSIEWSRIQPQEGGWNAEAIGHYKAYLSFLRLHGLEPVVALFHFTLPVWFAEKGGFEKRANVKYFIEYVDRLIDELGGEMKLIITINEPVVYATQGYMEGRWPPQKVNKRLALIVLQNLAFAHNKIATILHQKSRRFKVSIASNSSFVYAGDTAWLSERSATHMQYWRDEFFLNKVYKTCDFIGVNYYFSERVYGYRVHNPDHALSDIGWNMEPAHIQFVLERLHDKYKKPLLVCENGVADEQDSHRQWWIMQTIMAMQRAINGGVPLLGYLHWSLTDNFEWDKGFWPRFGLLKIDYSTGERTLRPSALWFGRVIKKLRGL
ncbi:glycoside hydrolase family 1 protein [Candidatus Saccharibacteria bacterium]|nr:glycoside hydrolase family 1 protein [Candidatus Saccharibacteria bacterium]